MLVGAPGEWTQDFDGDPAPYDGRLYVYRPAASAASVTRSPNPWGRGNFANAVQGAPDLDGDGVPDYYVGAPSESRTADEDDEGQGYLFSGRTGEPIRRIVSPEPSGDSAFGLQVSLVPDMNRDGRPEVVFTDPTACCDKMPAAYVFDGAAGGLIYSVELPYITWDLESALGVPDLDGDGRGELAVGVSVGTFDEVDAVVVFSGDLTRNEIEPNDNLAEAQPLLGGPTVVIEGFSTPNDFGFNGSVTYDEGRQNIEDLFRVDILEPGLRATLTGFDNDLDLYLLDPDLAFVEISGNGDTDDEAIDLPDLPVGTYYLGVDFCGTFSLDRCQEDYDEWTAYTLTVEASLAPPVAVEEPPATVALGLPHPNPFSGRASVEVTATEPGLARLVVYDVLGREVAVLWDGPLAAVARRFTLDGASLSAGVYLLRLTTTSGTVTRRITRVSR